MGSHTKTQRCGKYIHKAMTDDNLMKSNCTQVPRLVQWMATLRCGLACPHCLSSTTEEGFQEMSLEKSFNLVEQVADLGVNEFLVTGGEPLARQDLHAVIEHLGRCGVSWSLNTAIMPSAEQRREIEKYPPMFVAVSLDGPESVHDEFRGRKGAFEEALTAIRYFSSLDNCEVAAGTTVTAFNFPTLRETFQIAFGSGAHAWGIHLPVAEGRASLQKDLFLSKKQLSWLLRFVAEKRKYFPINMADEFGYCGDWEPLVRDEPLYCGAGRTHCVVLPDGEVVPCTTLDRSTSAGNIYDRSLMDIWEHGFADLRKWEPQKRCKSCDYSIACQGACWLQRRHGKECYRELWHVPQALKTAAGVAICLGVLYTSGVDVTPVKASDKESTDTVSKEIGTDIEGSILRWRGDRLNARKLPGEIDFSSRYNLTPSLLKDPAGIHFLALIKGELPDDIQGRCSAIKKCLKTNQRSLSFAVLLWQELTECCLDGDSPEKRSGKEREALRNTMTALQRVTLKWRKEIYDKKLDPYLARGRTPGHSMISKKGPSPSQQLQHDTNKERWGLKEEALEGYLERHPYAESMQLTITAPDDGSFSLFSEGKEKSIKGKESIGIFEILVVPKQQHKLVLSSKSNKEEAYTVIPPSETELTYPDLLRLCYEQNADKLDVLVTNLLLHGREADLNAEKKAILMPAMRKLQKSLNEEAENKDNKKVFNIRYITWWLSDFWLF
ncbi:radical SAM/SPASM domain-containing protein [Planctomycetota bacterium]